MLKLKQGFTLVTILVAITFVALSSPGYSWAAQVNRTQDEDSESKVSSETILGNDISRKLNNDKGSKDSNEPTRATNVTRPTQTVGRAEISIALTESKFSGGKFIVNIDGNHPTPSTFDLGPGYTNPKVELLPGNYKVNIKFQDNGIEPVEQHDIVLSEECSGKISAGQHKTCEIQIHEWPKIIVHTHAAAEGTKASDFTLEAIGGSPVPSKFPGNEDGTIIQMKYGDYGVHFKPANGFFSNNYQNFTVNSKDYGDFPCIGKIVDDGSPFTTKVDCKVTIDISKLKVITKVEGGPTPVSSIKYKIKSNDLNVNGKEFNGNAQGTQIPIGPGAYFSVEVSPYSNYDPTTSGECVNGHAQLGKINVCTITMKYNVEQDTCHTEINEQGKPVKVC
jgi:hypothetical protein